MAELRNQHLIEIHNLHSADGELLNLLKSVDKMKNMFKDFETKIARGIPPNDLELERHLQSLTMAISNVMVYMIYKNINIDRTKVLFEQMLNETMRQIKRENVRTGREQVENLIQQSRIPVMQRNYINNAQLMRKEQFVAGYVPEPIVPSMAQPGAPRMAQRMAPRVAESVAAQPVAAQNDLREPTEQPNIDELDQEGKAKLGVSYSKRLNCSICQFNEVNTVLIPCGHLFCSACIQRYKQKQIDEKKTPFCPQCRNEYTSMHNIFFQKYLKYKNKYLQLKTKDF